jgi:hypothetical protein
VRFTTCALLAVVVLGTGCRSATESSDQALISTTAALIAAGFGQTYARGCSPRGCIADCSPGTVCNNGTGLCDPVSPCFESCGPGTACDVSGPIPECVEVSTRPGTPKNPISVGAALR